MSRPQLQSIQRRLVTVSWYAGFAYLAAIAILVAAVSLILRLDYGSPSGVKPSKSAIEAMLDQTDAYVAVGSVVDQSGNAVPKARVFLEIFGERNEKLFDRDLAVDAGVFSIRKQDLPAEPGVYVVSVKAEAPFYLAGSSDHIVRVSEGKLTFDQPELRIRQTQLNPSLTTLLLLPALFGLLFSILHVTQLDPALRFTALYAAGTSVLWSVVAGKLVWIYAKTGDALIPLFWPDLIGPSGAVVFAFIGSLTYAAYSILAKPTEFHTHAPTIKRQKLLLTLGERVLVAPYIALVVLAVYGSTFPNYNSGPFAAFISFFTGLYIPVVLTRLNQLGLTLLSAAQQARVTAKATQVTGREPGAPSQSAAAIKPSQGLFDAVAEARQKLVAEHKTVIGVTAGNKQKGGIDTGDRSVVVYVVEKQDLPEKRVPSELGGTPH